MTFYHSPSFPNEYIFMFLLETPIIFHGNVNEMVDFVALLKQKKKLFKQRWKWSPKCIINQKKNIIYGLCVVSIFWTAWGFHSIANLWWYCARLVGLPLFLIMFKYWNFTWIWWIVSRELDCRHFSLDWDYIYIYNLWQKQLLIAWERGQNSSLVYKK